MSVFEDNNQPLPLADVDFGAPAPAVAVALSGGPDSMALCRLLSQWAVQNDVQIYALTVDHGLRVEAAAEAAQVGQWVRGWPHVRHEVLKLDVPLDDTRVMEKARDARYDALADYCHRHGIEKLFVAHHRDDQAETFLFRLAKGSGLDGLAAMRPESVKAGLRIARPFLAVSKARLVATCRALDVSFVEDPTNDDARYARPRLRQSYDVLAAEGLTPKRLAVTAARLGRARDALEHYAVAAFQKHLKEKNAGKVILDYAGLRDEPAETRLRVLIMAMEGCVQDSGGYGSRRERIEELADALFGKEKFRRQTLGGCIFTHGGDIIIERENA